MHDLLVQFDALFSIRGSNPPIIHIISEVVWVLLQQGVEVTMHGALEERGCVCQSEIHDLRNVGSFRGLEGHLVLILLLDANVVVTPSNVELRE